MLGRVLALALFAGMLASCGDGPNTQYLPIGQRCSQDDNCGTSPFDCDARLPGGYCEEPCLSDESCPTDAICVQLKCRRKCATSTDCRASEGYTCMPITGTLTAPYCDAATSN